MEVIGRCKIISNKWGIGSDSGTLVIMPIDDAPDGVVNAVRNINEGSSAIILIDHVKSGKYDVNKYVNNDSNTVIVIEYMGMA
jgi:hypothetical protein